VAASVRHRTLDLIFSIVRNPPKDANVLRPLLLWEVSRQGIIALAVLIGSAD